MSYYDITSILSEDFNLPATALSNAGALSSLRSSAETTTRAESSYRTRVVTAQGEADVLVTDALFSNEKVTLPLWAVPVLLPFFSLSLPKHYSPAFTGRISSAASHLMLRAKSNTYYATAASILTLRPALSRSSKNARLVSDLKALHIALQTLYAGERSTKTLDHSLAPEDGHDFKDYLDEKECRVYDIGVEAVLATRDFDKYGPGKIAVSKVIARRAVIKGPLEEEEEEGGEEGERGNSKKQRVE